MACRYDALVSPGMSECLSDKMLLLNPYNTSRKLSVLWCKHCKSKNKVIMDLCGDYSYTNLTSKALRYEQR